MLYLLIDNTSLLQLIESVDNEFDFVSDLDTYVERGNLKLFSHELLIAEWDKHKNDWEERLKKKKYDSEIQGLNIGESINIRFAKCYKNREILERLLLASTELRTNQGLESEIGNRIKNKLAPFHNSQRSVNDWNIFGSFCLHCEQYNVEQLFFISHNHNDFSDDTDKDRKIHLSLRERFPYSTINYFRNYSDFFRLLKGYDFRNLTANIFQVRNSKFNFRSSKLGSKKNGRILESLYNVFTVIYDELTFIPLNSLIKMYPFSKSEKDHVYYSGLELRKVSEDLVSFFRSIEVAENGKVICSKEYYIKGIDDWEEKLKTVLRSLRNNLIISVNSDNTKLSTKIPALSEVKGNDSYWTYGTFSFAALLHESRNNTTGRFSERLRNGYVEFQMGNFSNAYSIFNQVRKQAWKLEKYIIYFIATYNLRQLFTFFKNPFYSLHDQNEKILEELSTIDLQGEADKVKNISDEGLINLIGTGQFFNRSAHQIVKFSTAIQDHYYSQLNGGWSSNSNISNMMNEFYQLDSFLVGNSVIFDNYSNYKELFEHIINGIYASHAIAKDQGERFAYFDDYWVLKFVTHGSKDALIRYFNRYKLSVLQYKSSNTQFCFNKISDNFFKSLKDETFQEQLKVNGFLYDKQVKFMENFIVMAALLDLNNEQENQFAAGLIDSFIEVDHVNNYTFNISLYLKRKGSKINDELLMKLFRYSLTDLNKQSIMLLGQIVDELKTTVSISLDELKILLSLHNNENCDNADFAAILIGFYRFVDSTIQYFIKEYITGNLKTDLDVYLFCYSTIEEIVDFDRGWLKKAIKKIDFSQNYPVGNFFTDNFETRNFQIENILTVCFKYRVNTKTNVFKKIKDQSDFYTWLIDLNNFDYELFKPEWILRADNKYVFDKMSKSDNLLKYLSGQEIEDEKIRKKLLELYKRRMGDII